MSYEIEARLENDRPCLRILDADSHTLRLVWHYPRQNDPASTAETGEQIAVHDLFRELFLLSLIRHEEGAVKLQIGSLATAGQTADRYSR